MELVETPKGHPSQQSSSHWRHGDTQGTKQYPGHGRQGPCWSKGGEANPKVTIPAGLRRQNKVGSYHVV